MRKRIFALAMSAVMALSLSGCGENEKSVKTGGDDNTLTYWAMMDRNIATRVNSFNDVAMYKKLEEETGMHIEFIHPPIGQEKEQFNLLLTSDELPDIIEFWWPQYPGGVQKAIDDGIIIALNDYLEDYAPNFSKLISEGELAEVYDKGAKTDDGNYFGFPNCDVGEARTFGGPVLRKDWLDELGLDVPETIDEWTNVLRAFKEKKGATAPLTGGASYFTGLGAHAFNGAFDIGKGRYIDNGKVKFGPIESNYKAYLEQLHSWYEEGLLDKDFGTVQSKLIDAKMTNGESGATIGYLGGTVGAYLTQMKERDPNYDLVCAQYPVLEKGDVNRFGMFEADVNTMYAAITPACKNPEAAVKWLDYLYGEDGYLLMNFGVEGESYTMVDGKPVYTDLVMNNPDGLTVTEALALQCRASNKSPGLKQAPEYLEQYYQFPQQQEGFKLWTKYADEYRKVNLPDGLCATQDESAELATLETDINTYVEEMAIKFVTGIESFDKFDDFVNTLHKQFNVDRYLEIQQSMYDRYLKR